MSKDETFFYPKGAPLFKDRVYKFGEPARDIKKGDVIGFKDIIPMPGVEIYSGMPIPGFASIDNKGNHRELPFGRKLPQLIFPE